MILVVDDHDDTRCVLIRLLKASGHDAVGVCDGAQALLFLRSHRPRLIILDCHMPCVDGFEVLRALRGDAALADLPVVMFSADSAASGPARQAGADGFILKGSLDWARLTTEIERFVRNPVGDRGPASGAGGDGARKMAP